MPEFLVGTPKNVRNIKVNYKIVFIIVYIKLPITRSQSRYL